MAAAKETPSLNLACLEFIPEDLFENKNPIVYIHTVGNSKELWPHEYLQIIADTTTRKSFVLDARCHGDSPHTDEFSPDLIAEDLLSFYKSKQFEKAVLVGHGLGGMAVTMFALKYPEKVEMMINVEGALKEDVVRKTNKKSLEYLKLWAESVRSAPGEMSIDDVVRRAYDYVHKHFSAKEGLEPKDKFYKYTHPIKKVGQAYDVKHNVPAIAAYLEKSVTGEKLLNLDGKFNGPALFMVSNDSAASEDVTVIAKRYFFRPTFIAPKTTHHIHLLYPQQFMNYIIDFFEKNIYG